LTAVPPTTNVRLISPFGWSAGRFEQLFLLFLKAHLTALPPTTNVGLISPFGWSAGRFEQLFLLFLKARLTALPPTTNVGLVSPFGWSAIHMLCKITQMRESHEQPALRRAAKAPRRLCRRRSAFRPRRNAKRVIRAFHFAVMYFLCNF